jgi:hypothetical protein
MIDPLAASERRTIAVARLTVICFRLDFRQAIRKG